MKVSDIYWTCPLCGSRETTPGTIPSPLDLLLKCGACGTELQVFGSIMKETYVDVKPGEPCTRN